MKKKVLAVVSVSLSLMLAAVLVSTAMAARDAFVGRWHSTDIVDGSSQRLMIGGGPGSTRNVRWYDDGASACGLDESDNPIYAAFVSGSFTENEAGDELDGSVDVTCLTTPPSAGPTAVAWQFYDNGDGTLSDSDGTTWYPGP